MADRTEQPPARLYKYRSIKQALQLLKDGTLWWSPPRRFDDLHDCAWNPYEPLFNEEAVRKVVAVTIRRVQGEEMDWQSFDPEWQQVWRDNRKRYQEMTPETRREMIDTFPDYFRRHFGEALLRYKRQFDGIIDRLRVLCLCDERLSEEMWKAYADDNSGCVLGFDTNILEREWRIAINKVEYGSSPPVLFAVESFHKDLLGEIADRPENEMLELGRRFPLYKREQYRFEREWRFVHAADASKPHETQAIPFPPHALVEVGFGSACSTADEEAVRAAALELKKHRGGPAFRFGNWSH